MTMTGLSHELATIAQVHTSHCCICSKELADSKSQELGIGPVCRKRYMGDPEVPLTEKGWEKALGVLVQSGLPEPVVDGVLDRKPDAHKATNLVVYWASAHHTDRDVVLTCSNIIRHLGYTSMADRLESDRADLTFETTEAGDAIHVYCKRHPRFNWGLRQLGASVVKHDSGRFKCWSVPAARKPSLVILAGVHFGGLKCWADDELLTIEPRTADEFKASLPAPPKPKAQSNGLPAGVTVRENGNVLYVEAGYSAGFVSAIRGIRGRRYEGDGTNSFPLSRKDDVLALVQQHFGGQA